LAEKPAESGALDMQLQAMARQAEASRDNLGAGGTLDLEQDEQLMQRLRGLGYIE